MKRFTCSWHVLICTHRAVGSEARAAIQTRALPKACTQTHTGNHQRHAQGYHTPCGVTAQQIQYNCTPPSCVAGTALDLTGSCSTALTGGTLSYIGADGAPPPAVCPGPGEIVPVYPVVADGDCTYDGPAFGVTGELHGVCEFKELFAYSGAVAQWLPSGQCIRF